jgi:hypothetical protein
LDDEFSFLPENKARNKINSYGNRRYQDGHAHSVRRLAVLPDNLAYLRVRPPSETQATNKSIKSIQSPHQFQSKDRDPTSHNILSGRSSSWQPSPERLNNQEPPKGKMSKRQATDYQERAVVGPRTPHR